MPHMEFKEAIQRFSEKKAIRNERASYSYGLNADLFRRWVGKGIAEVDDDDIVRFQRHLKQTKSEATQHIYAISLRAFFKFCVSREWSRVKWQEIEIPRVTEKVPTYVVQPEFEKLCDIAKDEPIKLLVLRMLWFTGVRVSELCDIEVRELDLAEMCCYVHSKKAFRPKIISWDSETNDLVLKVLGNEKRDYLFAHGAKQYNVRQIQRWIEDLRQRAGILKPITPHSFRHGFTKEHLNVGTDLPALGEMLGHKNPASLFKYTKRLDSDIREKAREALRKRLGTAKFKEIERLFKEGS